MYIHISFNFTEDQQEILFLFSTSPDHLICLPHPTCSKLWEVWELPLPIPFFFVAFRLDGSQMEWTILDCGRPSLSMLRLWKTASGRRLPLVYIFHFQQTHTYFPALLSHRIAEIMWEHHTVTHFTSHNTITLVPSSHWQLHHCYHFVPYLTLYDIISEHLSPHPALDVTSYRWYSFYIASYHILLKITVIWDIVTVGSFQELHQLCWTCIRRYTWVCKYMGEIWSTSTVALLDWDTSIERLKCSRLTHRQPCRHRRR